MLDLLPEQENTFVGRYRDQAEDLRSGKLRLAFTISEDQVTGFMEEDLISFEAEARDE